MTYVSNLGLRMMFWDKWKEDYIDEIAQLKEENAKLLADMEEMKKKQPPELTIRVADLEVKMSKLWGLLLQVGVNGKERVTKMGKLFGGKL